MSLTVAVYTRLTTVVVLFSSPPHIGDAAITIDAGGPVHSITFYSQSLNCWKDGDGSDRRHVTGSASRFPTCDVEVTLVTGLKNGRIRTWDARTGTSRVDRFVEQLTCTRLCLLCRHGDVLLADRCWGSRGRTVGTL